MVGLGMWFLFIFSTAFYLLAKRNLGTGGQRHRWLLRLALYSIPLPWIACELGWIVAEYGRQPWTISGVLPTALSVSSLPASSVYASLAAFIVFYTALFIVEMYLMLKYIRLGPGSLGTGRYFGEAGAPRRRSCTTRGGLTHDLRLRNAQASLVVHRRGHHHRVRAHRRLGPRHRHPVAVPRVIPTTSGA